MCLLYLSTICKGDEQFGGKICRWQKVFILVNTTGDCERLDQDKGTGSLMAHAINVESENYCT